MGDLIRRTVQDVTEHLGAAIAQLAVSQCSGHAQLPKRVAHVAQEGLVVSPGYCLDREAPVRTCCRRQEADMTVEFLVTTLIVVATPGTGVIYTLAAGLSRGGRASVIAAVGCTLGIVPHMIAAITGLAALLHTSALAFQTLKYLGVVYLIYMAWVTLKEKGAVAVAEDTTARSSSKVILSGILINILNPKLTIFFFAFLPQFISTSEPHASLQMLELSAVFMLITFVVFSGYGVFAAAVRTHVVSRPRVMTWMRRVFAGSFVALGARLAITSR